jgi:carboxymethylenebutenolidase
VDIGYTPEDIAKGRELKAKAQIDAALRDVSAARAAAASAGKVGIVGYCWGGYVTWMAASRLPGFGCAVPYYGGGMLEAIGERPLCPVMAHFGERDTGIPVDGVRKFATAHPEVQVFIYAADHGFNCDQRGSYDAAAAKLARERTLAFLQQHIG